MSYDLWKTTEPDDDLAKCDCCGRRVSQSDLGLAVINGIAKAVCSDCDHDEENEEPEPCTDLARRQGCTCEMAPYAYEEVRISRNCPLHGSPIDPDDVYHDRRSL